MKADETALLSARAVETLSKLLDSKNEKVKRMAAKNLLDHTQKLREQDIERRLTELEQEANTGTPRRG